MFCVQTKPKKWSEKMKKIILSIVVVTAFLSGGLFAGNEHFVCAYPCIDPAPGSSTFANAELVPQGNTIQGIRYPNINQDPPTTNAANNYLQEATARIPVPGLMVGTDDDFYCITYNGYFSFAINGEPSQYGWARVYSSVGVSNSVYYGDSPVENLDSDAYNSTGWIVVEKYNPAYVITFSLTPGGGAGVVTGTVTSAMINNGNNSFVATDLEAVCDGRTGAIATDGTFIITGVSEGEHECYVHVKDARSERPPFPKSADHNVDVGPGGGPVQPVVVITAPNDGENYSTNVGTHTISVDGTINWN